MIWKVNLAIHIEACEIISITVRGFYAQSSSLVLAELRVFSNTWAGESWHTPHNKRGWNVFHYSPVTDWLPSLGTKGTYHIVPKCPCCCWSANWSLEKEQWNWTLESILHQIHSVRIMWFVCQAIMMQDAMKLFAPLSSISLALCVMSSKNKCQAKQQCSRILDPSWIYTFLILKNVRSALCSRREGKPCFQVSHMHRHQCTLYQTAIL